MRPGGTQTKRGAAVRMRRRLGLAPRAYALLSCSLVLVIAGVSAYGMTVPSMMQAHTAREPRVGHEVKSDLGTTTGYAWASVVAHIVFGTDDADGAEAPDNEVTLANGKTIVLTNTKIIDRLSNNSVAATVNKVEQQKEQDAQQSGKPGSSDTSGSGSDSSSSVVRHSRPGQSGISSMPICGAVTPTYVNGSAITAMMTSRSVTSTITWRRLPYDDRSCIHHTTIARSRSHGRPAPGACRRV